MSAGARSTPVNRADALVVASTHTESPGARRPDPAGSRVR